MSKSDWLTSAQVLSHFGFPRSTLSRWRRNGSAFLAGRRIHSQKSSCITPDGRHVQAWVYNVEDLEAVQREADRSASDKNWLLQKDVKAQYQIGQKALTNWTNAGCPFLGGRKLKSVRKWCRRGRRLLLRSHYLRKDLDQIARSRASKTVSSETQGWFSYRQAKALYGFSLGALWKWRTKPCTYLDGRKLAAKKVNSRIRGNRSMDQWRYYRKDLEIIATKQAEHSAEVYQDCEGSWVSLAGASQKYQIHPDNLRYWRDVRCPHLDGAKLRAKKVWRPFPANKHGWLWVYLEKDLRRIAGMDPAELDLSMNTHVPIEPPAQPRKKSDVRRGRPKGSVDPKVAERTRKMLEAWDQGEFRTKAQAGRAYSFNRPDASKLINKHERKKRRKNSRPAPPVKTS